MVQCYSSYVLLFPPTEKKVVNIAGFVRRSNTLKREAHQNILINSFPTSQKTPRLSYKDQQVNALIAAYCENHKGTNKYTLLGKRSPFLLLKQVAQIVTILL